jgi:hypothetical protein
MRQFLLGLSLSIAFILGCVTAQHLPSIGVPPASANVGAGWEYYCQTSGGGFPGAFADKLTEAANTFGSQGYRLVPVPAGEMVFLCFERPIP